MRMLLQLFATNTTESKLAGNDLSAEMKTYYEKRLIDLAEPKLVHEEVESYIRKSGGKIIQRKGATFYAVAVSVCHLCKCIFSGADTALTVSTMMHGEYGIEDVALSTLTIVGPDGMAGKIIAPLTEEETAKLHKSADALKEVIAQIEI